MHLDKTHNALHLSDTDHCIKVLVRRIKEQMDRDISYASKLCMQV